MRSTAFLPGPILRRSGRLALCVVGLLSCSGETPTGTNRTDASFAISDAVHSAGNEHFYFLPPLVPQPTYGGAPDPGALPQVSVCEWTTSGCGAIVALFSSEPGVGMDRILYDASTGAYHVNWHTDQCLEGTCTLDATKTYRLRVLSGTVELGFADLDVVNSGRDLRNVQTGEYVGLLNGRTLPVKFRVEVGAVAVLEPGESAPIGAEGGQVTTAAGDVSLEFPAGALGATTPITVENVPQPAEGPLAGAPVVELSPDGTTFAVPVTLSLSFAPEILPEGVDPGALTVLRFDGTGWEPVEGGSVDLADNTVSAPVEHFSTYSIGLYPNRLSPTVPLGSVVVGSSITISGFAAEHVTYYSSYRRCVRRFFGRCTRWETVVSHQVNTYPLRYYPVYWTSNTPALATIPSGPTYTNQYGWTTSPPLLGVRPGIAQIVARVAGLTGGGVGIPVLGQLAFVPGDRSIVAGWAIGQQITRSVTEPTALDVAVTNMGRSLVIGEPGTANYTYPTQTRTYTIPADATAKLVSIQGLGGVGVDTLVASAPGYLPDTTIVTLVKGRFRVDGWPSELAFGDSAQLTLTVVDSAGAHGSLAYPIDVAAALSGGLVLTRGGTALSAIRVGQRHSEPFYVKATATGEQSVTLSHSDYVDYTNTLTVGAPPTIGVSATSVTIPVQQGATNTAEIQITNVGGGTLSGLEVSTFSNYYVGGVAQWVTATLSSTTAPATLTITASPDAFTSPEVHRLRFDLSAPGATNSPFTFFSIFVTVIDDGVTPVDATIVPSPTSVAFTVQQGRSGSAQIAITNSGRDPLTDLTVGSFSNYFNGSPAPWVTATVSPTTAPATITITASPDASVSPETHRLRFEVASPGATNSPYTFFSINVTVEPGPTWTEVAPMPTPRWGMQAATLGGEIYTIGGNASPSSPYPGGPVVRTVEAYNPTTNTWSTKAPLPVPLEHALVTVHQGRIWVIGGWRCNLCGSSTVYSYNPLADAWTQHPNAPYNLHGGVAASIGGRIYVTTATCCGSPGAVFRAFDPSSGVWSNPPPMPHAHEFPAGGGVIDGKFYVVGGYGAVSYLDVYDTATQTWRTKTPLPIQRQHGGGAVVDGKLLVFAGESTSGERLGVYAYDPATDSWSLYTQAPRERNLPGVAEAGGAVYLMGGTSSSSPYPPIAEVDRLQP